jgi:hypothetical protein
LNRKGIPQNQLICTEGDPNCDFDPDPTNHSCTFRVTLCINNSDPRLFRCSPVDIATFEVKRPSPTSRALADMANVATLEGQAGNGFGVTVVRRGTNVLRGTTNATLNSCSGPLVIVVPLRKLVTGKFVTGRTTLSILTVSSDAQRDRDSLMLQCKP